MRLGDEVHGHHTVGVGKQALVAITKVEAPQLDVLVGRRAYEHGVVGGDGHAHDRQTVPVPDSTKRQRVRPSAQTGSSQRQAHTHNIQGQEELERVFMKHLHGAVKQSHGQQKLGAIAGVAVSDTQHVV